MIRAGDKSESTLSFKMSCKGKESLDIRHYYFAHAG